MSTSDELQRQRRILISEMNDATDSGNLSKRRYILDKIFDIEHELHKLEFPVQKAPDMVRTDFKKPWWKF